MSRDLEAARGQLQAVLDRIQQTAQQAAIESSEAHEISQAMPPEQPSFAANGADHGGGDRRRRCFWACCWCTCCS